MGENEYIQLNDLLTKYRIKCLKEYAIDIDKRCLARYEV